MHEQNLLVFVDASQQSREGAEMFLVLTGYSDQPGSTRNEDP